MHQQPRIGETVHYVSYGSPVQPDGSQAFTSQCRAAAITGIKSPTEVDLFVMNPTGVFLNQGCLYIGKEYPSGMPGGSWHNLNDCTS